MFDTLLSIIAPHYCYRCHKIGGILCIDCKKYIISQKYEICVLCGQSLKNGNLCKKHKIPCDMIWCFTKRTGVAAKIIDDYKFKTALKSFISLVDFNKILNPHLESSLFKK